MRLTVQDVTVTVRQKTILSHLSFEIKGRQRIALVGANGSGKTTFLRLLNGEILPDHEDAREGKAILTDRERSIGMLSQVQNFGAEKTVEDLFREIMKKRGIEETLYDRERFLFESEFHRIFTGFGFAMEEKKKRLCEFSGGEQTKLALIGLLLEKPDLLLLDEPTNHLDLKSLEWLEDYLLGYENAVVIVSHDRYFLDRVATDVYYMEDGRGSLYPGGYSDCISQKKREWESRRKAYEAQTKEIERLNRLIETFKHKPKKASFARAQKKRIERMEKIEPPKERRVRILTEDLTPPSPGSKWVFEAKDLEIGYEKTLFSLTLRIKRGSQVGITGENGSGKSTLIKTLAGMISPRKGSLVTGNGIEMGYFDQNSADLTSELTVAEHFLSLYPSVNQKDARNYLAAFLFPGREAQTKVSSLSGGEKARLVLAELLYAKPNLLILDEPTNHMDIPAKEAIEAALQSYPGTLLVVSHDRYFLKKVAKETLVIEDGELLYYPFDYGHYLEKREKSRGLSIPALISAEEQALVSSLRAVPKGERHESRQLNSDEAFVDWQLGLIEEEMEPVLERLSLLSKEAKEREEYYRAEALKNWPESSSLPEPDPEEERLNEVWTELCMKWFEIWNGE